MRCTIGSRGQSGPATKSRNITLPRLQGLLSQVGAFSPQSQHISAPVDCPTIYTFFPNREIAKEDEESFARWLWAEIKGLNLAEWLKLQRTRSPNRVPYGDKPYKKKARSELSKVQKKNKRNRIPSSEDQYRRDSRKREHSVLEQERRERHRILQCILDSNVSDLTCKLTEKCLNDVKTMYGHQTASNKSQQAKTGKDEQFIANVFHQLMSQWVIDAQEELNMKIQDWLSQHVTPFTTSNTTRHDQSFNSTSKQTRLSLAVRVQRQHQSMQHYLPSPTSSDDE